MSGRVVNTTRRSRLHRTAPVGGRNLECRDDDGHVCGDDDRDVHGDHGDHDGHGDRGHARARAPYVPS